MKEKRLFSMFIVALFAVAGVTTLARAASTEELVAAAKKEGIREVWGAHGHACHEMDACISTGP